MNKQEAIEKIKGKTEYFKVNKEYNRGFRDGLNSSMPVIREIDEPEKPVVPQFVADWYEKHKGNLEYDIYYDLCIKYHKRELNGKLRKWFGNDSKTKPIETLVKMKLYGYEVKKEKLYTVKFANEDFGTIYIGIFKKFNKLGISSLPLNDDEVKVWFTEDELKRFKFWDNPAFEVDEVKK